MASSTCSRTEDETNFIEAVNAGDVEVVRMLLKKSSVHVDIQDEYGVTPLQNAAYRGNVSMCRILLEHGAEVNANFHKFQYSTLTFAALSGNPDVTQLFLEAGADIKHKNSSGKTAADMALYTHQHQCAALINNFFPRMELSQILSEEISVPAELNGDILGLLRMSNLHPLKLCNYFQEHSKLLENAETVCDVLEALTKKYTKSKDQMEKYSIRILKIHYFSFVLQKAAASYKDHKGSLRSLLKSLAKGRDEDGFQETAERLVRQSLKEFPHTEMPLFQTIVKTVAETKIGAFPCAIDTITSELTGRKLTSEKMVCDTCGEPGQVLSCSVCKKAMYCNKECQKLHWPTHKKFCKALAAQESSGVAGLEEDLREEVIKNMKKAGLAD